MPSSMSGTVTARSPASSLSSKRAGSPCGAPPAIPRSPGTRRRPVTDRVVHDQLPDLGAGHPARLAMNEHDGHDHALPLELQLAGGGPVAGGGYFKGSGEHRGEDGRPHVKCAGFVAVRPAPRGLADHGPGPAIGLIDQLDPAGRECVVPQVCQVLRAGAEPVGGIGRVAVGEILIRVNQPAVPSQPPGQPLELRQHRRGSGEPGELGRLRQPDRRQPARQPEHLLQAYLRVNVLANSRERPGHGRERPGHGREPPRYGRESPCHFTGTEPAREAGRPSLEVARVIYLHRITQNLGGQAGELFVDIHRHGVSLAVGHPIGRKETISTLSFPCGRA